MDLLEDLTIQRILNEVNKAASGGMFGVAGNYLSEPMGQVPSQLPTSENKFYSQDQVPLFYPTPDMFNMDGLTNFDDNINFNSIPSTLPMATPNNFDLYSNGLYNTMPQSFISPYENYNGTTKSNIKRPIVENSNKSTHSIASINHEKLLEQHHHSEDPTKISSILNHHGYNLSTTSQIETAPIDTIIPHDIQLPKEQIPTEPIETIPSTVNLISDKEGDSSIPPNIEENIDPETLNSAGRIFYDPNPKVIQRKGLNSVTYKQNIIVRFLQPPIIPNAGPLIVKEVRATPPPPLPPLVIKQRPTPPKTPPPLIIREKPPPLPSSLATKVITRQLPAEPAPPRAVIIERLPPLPAKPRDIIIERWLPYEIANQKRKVIVQRAQKSSTEHLQPKNIIITYEPVHAKVVRNFQKQNVIREDPQTYANRYGSQLYDTNLVIQQARAAGVFEDINPPASFFSSMTTNVATATDYEYQTSVPTDDNQNGKVLNENTETVNEDNNNQNNSHQTDQQHFIQTTSPVHFDENVQDEDVLVEENVTPFYINSGENLEETLQRLGLDLPTNIINDQHFSN